MLVLRSLINVMEIRESGLTRRAATRSIVPFGFAHLFIRSSIWAEVVSLEDLGKMVWATVLVISTPCLTLSRKSPETFWMI